MLNPSEPNTTRTINITYTTDDEGNMSIDLDAKGFEEDERMVPLFLHALLKTFYSAAEEEEKLAQQNTKTRQQNWT